jgi:hypothetical protein
MQRGDDDAAPHGIKQRESGALATTNILKRLELDQAHTAQCPRGGRLKGGEARPRHLGRGALLGNALEHLGESLFCAQHVTPRDERRVVRTKAAKVAECDKGDEERQQGKDHPRDADCKENLAIHGCILSVLAAPSSWVGYPLRTIL